MGLDSVELLLMVEEEFEVSITDQEAGDLFTVGDLVDMVTAKSQAETAGVYDRVRRIIVVEFGVAVEKVRPEARIVRDLGIN
jgi:acyl carrier protein